MTGILLTLSLTKEDGGGGIICVASVPAVSQHSRRYPGIQWRRIRITAKEFRSEQYANIGVMIASWSIDQYSYSDPEITCSTNSDDRYINHFGTPSFSGLLRVMFEAQEVGFNPYLTSNTLPPSMTNSGHPTQPAQAICQTAHVVGPCTCALPLIYNQDNATESPFHSAPPAFNHSVTYPCPLGGGCTSLLEATTKSLYAHLPLHGYRHKHRDRAFCPWPKCSRPSRWGNVARHIIERHFGVKTQCKYCGKTFKRNGDLKSHMRSCTEVVYCGARQRKVSRRRLRAATYRMIVLGVPASMSSCFKDRTFGLGREGPSESSKALAESDQRLQLTPVAWERSHIGNYKELIMSCRQNDIRQQSEEEDRTSVAWNLEWGLRLTTINLVSSTEVKESERRQLREVTAAVTYAPTSKSEPHWMIGDHGSHLGELFSVAKPTRVGIESGACLILVRTCRTHTPFPLTVQGQQQLVQRIELDVRSKHLTCSMPSPPLCTYAMTADLSIEAKEDVIQMT
ncbi:hypothetical protein EDC04DRAFT_2609433 [Pisolithus marmoratus]|nr:hypothetical protein EDC04DRAFT_2609433 [Pisolithus marmoratus]